MGTVDWCKKNAVCGMHTAFSVRIRGLARKADRVGLY